nr:uncharacterized protein LOC117855864 [Setaria viridis]
MNTEEGRLRLALLAAAPGAPADMPIDGLRRALAELPVAGGDNFSIRRFWPEQFLVTFTSQRARDAAMSAGSVPVGDTRFFFRPWTRLVRADSRILQFRVSLELDGVPAHAWSERTARAILSSSCWIEHVDDARTDMAKFKVQAWTHDPSCIPRRKRLLIAEHEQQIASQAGTVSANA